MRSLVLDSGMLLSVLVCSTLSWPTAALTQDADPDTKAYSSYQLTMPKYKKYLAATMNLMNASQQKPAVAEALENSLTLSIDEAVAALNRVPEARQSIAKAGITPRDYVLILGSFIQAQMVHGFTKQQGISADSARKLVPVSTANLEFVQKNEAEITRLNKEMEAKIPGLKPPDDDAGTN
jgi:hypothetical protein